MESWRFSTVPGPLRSARVLSPARSRNLFDVDQAIANAAKARNPGAVFAFRALKHKMEAALGLPGGGRLARLSDRKIEELMRLEIRERRESNEFAPPTSEEYQRNREVIAVLTSRLGRTGLDARRR